MLSKDVVQMDSSNNVTNLLTKTAEAIANVKKPYKTGAYGEMRTEYEGKLPKRVMDVDFEKVLTHFDQFSRLEEAKKESELAKENPLPLPPSPISVLTSLASARSSDSLICALQVQINKFVEGQGRRKVRLLQPRADGVAGARSGDRTLQRRPREAPRRWYPACGYMPKVLEGYFSTCQIA